MNLRVSNRPGGNRAENAFRARLVVPGGVLRLGIGDFRPCGFDRHRREFAHCIKPLYLSLESVAAVCHRTVEVGQGFSLDRNEVLGSLNRIVADDQGAMTDRDEQPQGVEVIGKLFAGVDDDSKFVAHLERNFACRFLAGSLGR